MIHYSTVIHRAGSQASSSSCLNTGILEVGRDPRNIAAKAYWEAFFDLDLDAFQAVNKIDSTEVSWTLGKIVLYVRRASCVLQAHARDPNAIV
jgi:hypothetical protein